MPKKKETEETIGIFRLIFVIGDISIVGALAPLASPIGHVANLYYMTCDPIFS